MTSIVQTLPKSGMSHVRHRHALSSIPSSLAGGQRMVTSRIYHTITQSLVHQQDTHARLRATAVDMVEALIFDCDGVIVESEGIHREAYNAAFQEFSVVCPGDAGALVWTEEFYDELQNTVGGGKPKMRWYFGKNGWPTSSVFGGEAPSTDEDKEKLVDVLQDWKTQKYKDIIKNGVAARPGIERVMDHARNKGIPVAVCSAATKEAVIFVLENLLGKERFEQLDLFMAGDDVTAKKPDPMIYNEAARRLQKDPSKCLVIEDSVIGLQAATGAGMACVITYTASTRDQDFGDASAVFSDMANVDVDMLLQRAYEGFDARTFV